MSLPKLVRDYVPRDIERDGKIPEVRTLTQEQKYNWLIGKLQEETREYVDAQNPAELADVLQVLYDLATYHDLTPQQLEEMRIQKGEEKGYFNEGHLLLDIVEKDNKP